MSDEDVFMSIPFLLAGDFDAIDQLCHYASTQFGGLQIYIILDPKHWSCRETLTYSHSKSMVCSTAGAMIGSYCTTTLSLFAYSRACETFLVRVDSDLEGMKVELAELSHTSNRTKFSRTTLPVPDQICPTTSSCW